jgi:hypothetical protein
MGLHFDPPLQLTIFQTLQGKQLARKKSRNIWTLIYLYILRGARINGCLLDYALTQRRKNTKMQKLEALEDMAMLTYFKWLNLP